MLDLGFIENELFVTIAAIFVLLLLSAFFSGSETALTAASEARLHQLSLRGRKRAGIVLRLRRQNETLIGAITSVISVRRHWRRAC